MTEPDRSTAREAGGDALGGEFSEELGIAFHREVQRAGSGLGELQAGEERILGGIDAEDEQRRLAFGARRAARPERHARPAASLDAPDTAAKPGAAVFVSGLGVLPDRIDRDGASMREGRGKGGVQIGPDARAGGIAEDNAIVDRPGFLVASPADHMEFEPVALNIDAGRQHCDTFGQDRAPVLAPGQQRLGVNDFAGLILPGLGKFGVGPDL
jgi:hypothetical protein